MHAHHHVVIWDLKFQVPSLVKWTMAPSHVTTGFLLLFPEFLLQSVLVATKQAWLAEIVGTVKEEEPEGEVIGDESPGSQYTFGSIKCLSTDNFISLSVSTSHHLPFR